MQDMKIDIYDTEPMDVCLSETCTEDVDTCFDIINSEVKYSDCIINNIPLCAAGIISAALFLRVGCPTNVRRKLQFSYVTY